MFLPYEKELHLWQQVSGICLTASRHRGELWVFRAHGTCVLTNTTVAEEGFGDCLATALANLMQKPGMQKIFTDTRVTSVLKNLDNM